MSAGGTNRSGRLPPRSAEPDDRAASDPSDGRCAEIVFHDTPAGLAPQQVDGFFAGWRRAVSPHEHLSILRGSDAVVLAVDPQPDRVVGFVTALSDGILCAHITLLEVLPAYRGRGIGRALIRQIMDKLDGLYAVDAVCDPELLPFYRDCGLTPAVAAVRRQYSSPQR